MVAEWPFVCFCAGVWRMSHVSNRNEFGMVACWRAWARSTFHAAPTAMSSKFIPPESGFDQLDRVKVHLERSPARPITPSVNYAPQSPNNTARSGGARFFNSTRQRVVADNVDLSHRLGRTGATGSPGASRGTAEEAQRKESPQTTQEGSYLPVR
jgi:hypothetical protein